MPITISSESESLLQKMLASGHYPTPEAAIEQALLALDAQEEGWNAWLRDHWTMAERQITLGLAQLDEGKGIPSEEAWRDIHDARDKRRGQ